MAISKQGDKVPKQRDKVPKQRDKVIKQGNKVDKQRILKWTNSRWRAIVCVYVCMRE